MVVGRGNDIGVVALGQRGALLRELAPHACQRILLRDHTKRRLIDSLLGGTHGIAHWSVAQEAEHLLLQLLVPNIIGAFVRIQIFAQVVEPFVGAEALALGTKQMDF